MNYKYNFLKIIYGKKPTALNEVLFKIGCVYLHDIRDIVRYRHYVHTCMLGCRGII